MVANEQFCSRDQTKEHGLFIQIMASQLFEKFIIIAGKRKESKT